MIGQDGRLRAAGLMMGCLYALAHAGCSDKPRGQASKQPPADTVTQHMDKFTMEGFAPDGSKRWELNGTGANIDGEMVVVQRPQGTGYDPARTAYLQARLAHVNQTNRRIRLEQDVSIHSSDGLWFQAPELYWLPDKEEFTTDQPVRLETDHILIRGRKAVGHTQLKVATIQRDVEVILNPTTSELPGQVHHVKITCEGPLTFDYERSVATFEDSVHVTDAQGDLYSKKLVAYLDRQTRTVLYAEAIGDVRIVQGGHTATGGRAVYEPGKGKVTLLDQPSLMMSTDQRSPTISAAGLGAAVGKSAVKEKLPSQSPGQSPGKPALPGSPSTGR